MAEPLRTLVRLFCLGEAVESALLESQASREALSALDELGLVRREGSLVRSGYRLVCHLGLFLFCEPVSSSARLYYGQDSLVLSQELLPAEGHVLDLCAGVGAQALVCAQTAASVTAVEKEALAEPVFRINAALNGLSGKVQYLIGDLFEPVPAGRRFDLISCNPPFMPVPPGVRYPLFADGGSDGLAVVRRLLAGLPRVLAPDGRCHAVGAAPGDAEGPVFAGFQDLAAEAGLAIAIRCLYSEELDAALLRSYTATAPACETETDLTQILQTHFARLGATHLYYFLLTANLASRPSFFLAYDGVQRVSVGA